MPLDAHLHAVALAGNVDPITHAVAQAGPGTTPGPEVLDAAEALCTGHLAGGTAAAGLEAMLNLVRRHRDCERLQLLSARLLDRSLGRAQAIPAWIALRDRFPACHEAFLVPLRWTLRMQGRAAAGEIISARFPDEPREPEDLLLRARTWELLGELEHAEADFARLALLDPANEMAPVLHARMLERRGDRVRARQVMVSALQRGASEMRLSPEIARLDADLENLRAIPPAAPGGPEHAGSRILAHLLEEATRRRGSPQLPSGALGRVMLINACLSVGGAERQFVNTAVGLRQAQRDGRVLAGRRIDGPVEAVCRSLDGRPGADFFLPALKDHGVPVERYDRFPPFGGDPAGSVLAEWRHLLHLLPSRVLEGTTRLADAIRARAPSVVHLWQDGNILDCALAALLAGVPRIVLSVRGAPPPDRPERDRPEYAVLYPLLMRAPGVVLTSNSHFAAARYADWIGLPRERVLVIPNGLSMPSAVASDSSLAMLDGFTARNGKGFTVGGVMRFVDNKRPLAWIECAARVLTLRPDSRFILVGEGELRAAAEARARELGIAERVLFAGRRHDVGFWLQQFDAFLLLSRSEGLPNVLIEAQGAGVPVVTTPAGGAAETLLDGQTGWVLGSATAPDLDEAAGRLMALANDANPRKRSDCARRFVFDRFSLARMVEQTMETYVA